MQIVFYMTINQRIKILLERLNIKQKEFADSIGCSRQLVNNWLTKNETVSPRYQLKILETYNNVNARWFLFGTEVQNDNGQIDFLREPSEKYTSKKDIILVKLETENKHLKKELNLKDEIIEMLKGK